MNYFVIAACVVLLLGFLFFLNWLSVRLDNLHQQVIACRAVLNVQLHRRLAAANELAQSGYLDPVTMLLWSDIATRCTSQENLPVVADGLDSHVPPELSETGELNAVNDRALLESELTRVIRQTLTLKQREKLENSPVAELLERLDDAAWRVSVARRFHNTRVSEVRQLRHNILVRVFHLAGRATLPQSFEIDDQIKP